MPLSGTIAKPRIVELVQAIRRHPHAAYAVAIGLIALATLARWAMGDYVGGEIPFITFFPAIRDAHRRPLARCLRHHPVGPIGVVSVHSTRL